MSCGAGCEPVTSQFRPLPEFSQEMEHQCRLAGWCVSEETQGSLSRLGTSSSLRCWPEASTTYTAYFSRKTSQSRGAERSGAHAAGTLFASNLGKRALVPGRGTQASFDLEPGKFCCREEALHGTWPTYETSLQGMNLALCGRRRGQRGKFRRITQAAGSPSVKYEGSSGGDGQPQMVQGSLRTQTRSGERCAYCPTSST